MNNTELHFESGDILGEGPLWHPRYDELWWVDIERGTIRAWSEENGSRIVLSAEFRIGAYAFTATDDLILATERGVEKWHAADGTFELLHAPEAGKGMRFNDGRVDPCGRFWVGSMPMDEKHFDAGLGALYRLDVDGSLHVMETGLTISNGIDWSEDGRTMVLTDTNRRRIYAYDFDPDAGEISNRRILVETDPDHGIPDGLVFDAEGYFWSAGIWGGCLLRYAPDGSLDRRIELDTQCPTSMAFGGSDLSRLFVTSARFHLAEQEQDRLAGSLISILPGVRGRPTNIYGVRQAVRDS